MHHKKIVLYLLFLCLLLCTSCSKEEWLPSWLDSARKVEYREIQTRLNGQKITMLDREAALADFDLFRYLIETSYSGYEYQKKFRKVNFDRNFREAEKKLKSLDETGLTADEFAQILFDSLKGVCDGHLFFRSTEKFYRTYVHEDYYYSGVTLIREGKRLLVEESSIVGITPGDLYKDSEKYLFRMYSSDSEKYRIGTLSSTPITGLSLRFGKAKIEVPVCIDAESASSPGHELESSLADGVAYLRIPDFLRMTDSFDIDQAGLDWLSEVNISIKKLSGIQTVIVDLRNNTGGYADLAALIPAVVFDRQSKNFYPEYVDLNSPGILQAKSNGILDRGKGKLEASDNHKEIAFALENQKKNPVRKWTREITRVMAVKEIENKKKVFLLINRNSASASEMVCFIRTIPGVTILGENSAGALSFVDIQLYILPDSQISLLLPADAHLDLSYTEGEGRGVQPDYWVLQNELGDTLRALTGVKDLKISDELAPKR